MKYIRTKDGKIIGFDTWKEMIVDNNKWLFLEQPNDNYCVPSSYIIKQADTPEELCDELVIKYKSEEKPRYVDMTELLKTCKNIGVAFRKHIKWLFTYYKDQLEICKLAIWTDKGLIYVAEVNEEGELKWIR